MKVRIKIDRKKDPGRRVALNLFLTQYFNKFYSDLNDTVSGYRSVQEHGNRDKIIQFVSGKTGDFDLLRLLIRGAFLFRDFDLLNLKKTDIEEQNARIREIGCFIAKMEENMRMSFVPVPSISHALQTYLNPSSLLIRGVDGCLKITNDENNNRLSTNNNSTAVDFKEMNRIMKIYLLREDVKNYIVSDGVLRLSSQQFECELVLCGLYSNPVWKIVRVDSAINSRTLEAAVMQRMDGSLNKLVQFLAYHDSCADPSHSVVSELPIRHIDDFCKIKRHFRVGTVILELDTIGFSFSMAYNTVDGLQKITRVELHQYNSNSDITRVKSNQSNFNNDNRYNNDHIITNNNKLMGWYSRNIQDGRLKETTNPTSNLINKNHLRSVPAFLNENILLFECFLLVTDFVSEACLNNAVITRHFMITVVPINSSALVNNNTQTPANHPNCLGPCYELIYLKILIDSHSFLDSYDKFESTDMHNFDTFSSQDLKTVLQRAELVDIQHNIPQQYKIIEHVLNEKLVLEIPGIKLLLTNSFKSTLRFLTEDCASFTFATALSYVINFHKFYLCSFLPLVSTEKSLIFDYEELLGDNITITVTPAGYKIAGAAARKALSVPPLFTLEDDSVFTKLFRAYIVNRFYAIKRILNISITGKNSLLLANNHSIVMTGEGLKYFDSEKNLVIEITRFLNTERIVLNALKAAKLIHSQ